MPYAAPVVTVLGVLGAFLADALHPQSADTPAPPQRPPLAYRTIIPLEIDGPQLEARIRALMQQRDIPAVCVGIVVDHTLVYSAALGEIDRSRHTPATRESLFQIGDITNTLTAT